MLEEKHDIVNDVLEEIVKEVETEISERFNSIEFKLFLKNKLKEKNVSIDFTDMENTKMYGEIEFVKYSTSFESLVDDISEDLIIHED
jgi:DNA-binding MltR family transcriptional regulator